MRSWWKRPAERQRRSDLSAYIDERSQIEGRYTFSGTVMLNGKFKGEIQSSDTLIVGDKAVVNGTVTAGAVVISGELVGSVQAAERVEMRGKARVFGDIDSPVLVIEEGVLFEGHCRMTKTHEPEVPAARDLSVVPLKR